MGLKSVYNGWVTDRKFIAEPESRVIFLTDVIYWHKNQDQLSEWCKANRCLFSGMTVEALDESSYLMFIMRWS